jgi:hypothetical protein
MLTRADILSLHTYEQIRSSYLCILMNKSALQNYSFTASVLLALKDSFKADFEVMN